MAVAHAAPSAAHLDASAQEFARFEVNGQALCVPSANVVQAIAYPQHLTRLPRGQHALEGVFMHRGQVLPLVNLQHWMAPAEPSHPGVVAPTMVLVLQAQDKWLAVLVQAVGGLMRVPAQNVQKIHHDSDVQEVFHSVVLAEDGCTLLSLLDPQRLAAQAQVWARGASAVAQPLPAAEGVSGAPGQRHTEAHTVFGLGTALLALPASAVGEVLARAVVQNMGGLSPDFIGMTTWRGRDVPVLDLLRLLGLPAAAGPAAPWLLVVHLDARVLAFPVHALHAVRTFDAEALQTGSALTGAMQVFCPSSCPSAQGERVYLLDALALLNASPLSKQAAQQRPAASGGALQLGYQNQATAGALVVFKSGQRWAASMAWMREIVKLPPNFPDASEPSSTLRGTLEWRGQPLAVIDLRKTLDAQPSVLTTDARIIVAEAGERLVAVLVESVEALIPGHAGTRARFHAQGALVEMVTVGTGTEQASYQIMPAAKWSALPDRLISNA